MERVCTICGNTVHIDINNSSKAIRYKNKYYHFDCFSALCDQRIANRRQNISSLWSSVKSTIDELIATTTEEHRQQLAKDELNKWLLSHYDVSFLNTRIYIKLSDVYTGTFKGLAYPISPMELLEEWQYYWNDLCEINKNKNIIGEPAIDYDLAILLSKNAEYRRAKEKEKIAQEILKQQAEEIVINTNVVKPKWQPRNKVADLYKEMNGGEDKNE